MMNVCGAVALLIGVAVAGGAEADATHPARRGTMRALSPDGGVWQIRVAPRTTLYPAVDGDVERPAASFQWVWVVDNDIPEAGDHRLHLRLGGSYGVLRFHPAGDPDVGAQLNIDAGFLAIADLDNSQDIIGWDGFYGFSVSWTAEGRRAVKVGVRHDSSHVGDEYIERTGRQRVNYTREELLVGVASRFLNLLWAYAEVGHAHDLRNKPLQEPWRLRAGLQYASDAVQRGRAFNPYAAIDANAYEENDWSMDLTVQAGQQYVLNERGDVVRLGLQVRRGRVPLGEFSQMRESYIGIVFEIRQ